MLVSLKLHILLDLTVARPAKPDEKDCAWVVKAMMDHNTSASSDIVQRLKFNGHSSRPGESVSNYHVPW